MDSQAVTVTMDIEQPWTIISHLRDVLAVLENAVESDYEKEISSLTAQQFTVEQPWTIIAHLRDVLDVLENAVESDYEKEISSLTAQQSCFPEDETEMRGKLNDLQGQWWKRLGESDRELFNEDGFYPYYTKQKPRILFVGREACWMAKKNYIDTLCNQLKNGMVGKWTVDQYPFHKRQFYIAYGLLASRVGEATGFPEWDKVPWASDLAKILFARCEKDVKALESVSIKPVEKLSSLSWAFMNLSKLSNETGDWRTDDRRYRPFVENKTNQMFIRNEIRILQPDIIIGSNVYDLVNILGYKRNADVSSVSCDYYESKQWPPFINCYHFSAIKKDYECFYKAVGDIIGKVTLQFDWGNNKTLETVDDLNAEVSK